MIHAAFIMLKAPSGRVLLLRRSGNGDHEDEWDLPGGKLEGDETPDVAAVRETKEETGYLTGSPGRFHMRSVRDGVDATTFLFDCEDEFEPELNDEHTGYMWVAPADALEDNGVRADAEFNEGDHPRDEDGKFAGGGGSSAPSSWSPEAKEAAATAREEGGPAAKSSSKVKWSTAPTENYFSNPIESINRFGFERLERHKAGEEWTEPTEGFEQITLSELNPTQKSVSPNIIHNYMKKLRSGDKMRTPEVEKHGGKYYINQGHHRLAAAMGSGMTKLRVRVRNFDVAKQ